MGEASTPSAKVCAACSKDVSQLPRTKDARGRYLCQECLAKLKAKSAAPAKPATAKAGEVDVMSKLLADTPGVELCPNCGGGITVGSKICIRCGFNKETGKAVRVQVELAKKDKKESSGPRVRLSLSPGLVLTGLIALIGGLVVLGMFDPTWAILLYAIASILGLMTTVWGIVAAFKDGDSLYGICGILSPLFFPGLVFLYYCLFKTGREYLKMTTWASLVGGLLAMFVIFGQLPNMVGEDQPSSRPRQTTPAEPPDTPPPAGTPIGG